MLEIDQVSKRYGDTVALDRLSFAVRPGQMYGFVGTNGAGKTTAMRIVLGVLEADSGTVRWRGRRLDADGRREFGYMPEERGLYPKMRVLDQLVYLARLRGMKRAAAAAGAQTLLDTLGLVGSVTDRVEKLSLGNQQRVQLAAALIHEPAALVLDEPFSGLDPINQDVLEGIVREFHARGTTILFSTHLMDQAERLCQRVCLISRARKVLDGGLRELKERERRGVLAVAFDGPEAWLEGSDVLDRQPWGDGLHLVLAAEADPQQILARAVAAGARIRRFELVEPRLHEIFVRHAGVGGAEDAGIPAGAAGGAA